jgi:hypothetical protein
MSLCREHISGVQDVRLIGVLLQLLITYILASNNGEIDAQERRLDRLYRSNSIANFFILITKILHLNPNPFQFELWPTWSILQGCSNTSAAL